MVKQRKRNARAYKDSIRIRFTVPQFFFVHAHCECLGSLLLKKPTCPDLTALLKVIPMFRTAHHLVRITLRLIKWRQFSPVAWKGVIKASFKVQMLLNSNFDNSTRLKSTKRSFQTKIAPLLSFWDETRTVIPFFYLCFVLVMATRKIYIKEKKVRTVEADRGINLQSCDLLAPWKPRLISVGKEIFTRLELIL